MTAEPPRDPAASTRRPAEWIARRIGAGEVLVAGCADPTTAIELARAGAEVTAFDADEQALERAREAATAAGHDIRYLHVQAAEWPFPAASFDAVVLDGMLEHHLRSQRLLSEARRVLRDIGTLALRSRYGLGAHGDHADALYLRRLVDLLAGVFAIDAIDLHDNVIVATARIGWGNPDPSTLLEIAERRLGEMDVIAYRLQREAESQRERADRLEATVRTMRASRGWQVARALREGSRSPGKLPRLLSDAFRRKS